MSRYTGAAGPQAAEGWQVSRLTPSSELFGANGMRFGPDGRIYVVQAFGSQISALDPTTGARETISPVGGELVAPDDIAFDSHGTMYVTEVMNARVSARTPNGEVKVIADNVPAANGIVAYQDRLFMDECRPGGRLWELYPDGRSPRLMADNLPLPNALMVGPDGKIYFPQIAAGEIWRCPLEGGTPEKFVAGLAVPTAVKFDKNGLLTTTQAGSGEITKIDIQSGTKTQVAKVRPGIDNFVIDDDNRLFISHFVDGGVAEITSDGAERVLSVAGMLGPFGLSVGNGTLFAADGMSLITLTADGQQSRPAQFPQEGFPGFLRGIAVGPSHNVYASISAGNVVSYDLDAHETSVIAEGLNELYGLAVSPDGSLVVAEGGSGRVLTVTPGGEVSTAASGLGRPMGVAVARDGSCYVSDGARGQVVHINGGTSTVLDGLQKPHGVTLAGDLLFVLDAGSKELIAFSLSSRQRQTVASNLPVGAPPGVTPKLLAGIAGLVPGPLTPFSDLAAGSDGTVHIAADGDGSVLAVKRA